MSKAITLLGKRVERGDDWWMLDLGPLTIHVCPSSTEYRAYKWRVMTAQRAYGSPMSYSSPQAAADAVEQALAYPVNGEWREGLEVLWGLLEKEPRKNNAPY